MNRKKIRMISSELIQNIIYTMGISRRKSKILLSYLRNHILAQMFPICLPNRILGRNHTRRPPVQIVLFLVIELNKGVSIIVVGFLFYFSCFKIFLKYI